MSRPKKDDACRIAWVIRAGIGGNADNRFITKKRLALSDPGLGDLSRIEPNRESFYRAYESVRPEDTRAAVTGIGGKFFRFAHQMQLGDVVLYPSSKTREVHVGVVIGKYMFAERDVEFPHQRKVRWMASFPKSSLSRTAQYELGAARTLFRYKRHLSEILQKIRKAKGSRRE